MLRGVAAKRTPPLLWMLLAGAGTSGCPLTDDYYVTPQPSETSSGGSGGQATNASGGTASGGKSSTSTGADTSSGGGGNSSGSGAVGGNGGGGGNEILEVCSRCLGAAGAGGGDECCEDGWAATAPVPDRVPSRERAASTATDSALFVWGGVDADGNLLNDGALYDVQEDSWRQIPPDANAPSPRHSASAVWTGRHVLVWGGIDSVPLADGALYDPQSGEWSPISDAPLARGKHVGAYLSAMERVVFWGGETETQNLLEGIDLYDVSNDQWSEGGTLNDPGKLRNPAWGAGVYTFWVFGGLRDGQQLADGGYYYSVSNSQWVAVQNWGAGSIREGGFGAFHDGNFFVWGGRTEEETLADGALYDVATGWRGLAASAAPSARYSVLGESGWAFGTTRGYVIVGGMMGPQQYLRDGGIFRESPDANQWQPIPEWPGTASHAFGAVAWVDGELIVWGGRRGSQLTSQGLRYLPQ